MITTFSLFPLIGNMTVEQTVATVRSLLNEQDNQRIQDLTIRLFANVAKQELHEKLIATSFPLYDYIFHATSDNIAYEAISPVISDVDYDAMNSSLGAQQLNNLFRMREIDLGRVVQVDRSYVIINPKYPGVIADFYGASSLSPIDYIYSVKSVSLLGHGTGRRVTYDDLVNIAHTDSQLWAHSFLWTAVGTKILIVPGKRLLDVSNSGTYDDFFKTNIFEIMAVRKPLLDDLLLPMSSVTYTKPIDLPNTQYSSMLLSIQKSCLESLQKITLTQIDQQIDASVQNKMQTVLTNKQIGAI